MAAQYPPLALVLIGLWTSEAYAQADCDADDLAERAAVHHEAGEYWEAIELSEAAYACRPDAILLFNIARAHHRLGQCVSASETYRRYLDTGDTRSRGQALQAEAEQTICADRYRDLMGRADAAREAGEASAAADLYGQAADVSAEPVASILFAEAAIEMGLCWEAIETLTRLQNQRLTETQIGIVANNLDRAQEACANQPSCDDMREDCRADRQALEIEHEEEVATQRLVGAVTTGVGAALLLGAIIHDVASQSTIDDYEAAAEASNVAAYEELRSSLQSRKTVSLVLYSSGLVLTAVGAVMWLASYRQSPADDLDCDSLCGGVGGPGDLGVWLGGRF